MSTLDRLVVCPFSDGSGRLISLWALVRLFLPHRFVAISGFLQATGTVLHLAPKRVVSAGLGVEMLERLPTYLEELRRECSQLGMRSSVAQLDRTKRAIQKDCPRSHLQSLLDDLRLRIEDDLKTQFFLAVPFERRDYYQRPDLFGPVVADHFPSAGSDIEEAGTCFALGRWTACVFHSMRVLEIGLVSLAKRLKIPKESREERNWGQVIGRVESELKKRQTPARGSRARRLLPLYSEAAANFRYFKDAWRNHVSHARESYDEEKAKRILDHVHLFMDALARLGLKG